jgi:hypothetical protein
VKRVIPLALLSVIALAAIAATCTIQNQSLTQIGEHDTFGGELHNDSGVDILSHRIRVAFLNSNGGVLETRTIQGCLRSLQDGGVNFFSLASAQDAEDTTVALARMANLQEDPGFKVGGVVQGNVEVSNVVVTRTGTELVVTGTIKNTDGDALEDPAACVVVYNDDDRVVVVGKDVLTDLAVDASGNFEVTLTVPDDADDVDSVDIWVDGLEDGTPTGPESSEGHAVTAVATATTTATPAPTNTPVPTPTP